MLQLFFFACCLALQRLYGHDCVRLALNISEWSFSSEDFLNYWGSFFEVLMLLASKDPAYGSRYISSAKLLMVTESWWHQQPDFRNQTVDVTEWFFLISRTYTLLSCSKDELCFPLRVVE